MKYSSHGFSVIEVILSAAIFMLFSTAAVTLILGGYNANRLGSEETIANQFAAEGIEAVKSIKNQAYSNLNAVNPTPRAVTRNVSNVWAFEADGTDNRLTHNASDDYIRQVKVERVNRDGSGNIVLPPSGANDPDTKKVTSTVSWNFNAARPESVVLTSYLSDWKRPIIRGGIIVYGDTTTTPKTRDYDVNGDSFNPESPTVAGASGLSFKIAISPIQQEVIAGYVNSSGTLQIMCYNGTSWTNEWTAPVGGDGSTRRFYIAYETNSGDVLVAYSRNSVATNAVDYKTKLGSLGCGPSNWSSTSSLPTSTVLTTGTVHWVQMAWDRRTSSNLVTAIWADSNSDLGAAVWSGTAWGNLPSSALETSLEFASTAQDVDSFDVEYESLSGNTMVVWSTSGSSSTNLLKYKRCTGGVSNCTWNTTTNIPRVADAGTNLDISANPDTNSNGIVMGAIDNGTGDLSLAYWSGSAWIGRRNVDTTSHCPVAGDHLVATGWLINGATTRSIIVYHDATSNTCTTATTNVGYYIGNAGSFSAGTDFTPTPSFGTQKWYDIQMDPFNKDQLMLTLSDANNDLFAKRLVMTGTPTFTWTNSDSGAALQPTLGQAIASPFSFAYWRQP